MTTQPVPAPICQWCHLPVRGTPRMWDGRPQCPDPIRCARRIPRVTARPDTEESQ